MDTCANEAIPQWGKHDLISHVYLHTKVVINKCSSSLVFVFQAVASDLRMETCYCIVTLQVSCFSQVCLPQCSLDDSMTQLLNLHILPVVPREAVAEVSRIGNL